MNPVVTDFDYRRYLRGEMERRAKVNPAYSLRAFARDLKMQPQVLSLVLNRKKGISVDVAASIADRLRLGDAEASYFLDLVQLSHAKTEGARRIALYRLQLQAGEYAAFSTLQDDVFRTIADWYHFALFELTEVIGFRNDPQWIARRLGISVAEAKSAVERLQRVGILRDAGGRLGKTKTNIATTHDIPSKAIRSFNEQILEKAKVAIHEQAMEERDFTTMTMAVARKQLPAAKRMIREFRRKMSRSLELGPRDDVYMLSVQFFSLLKEKK